jgi:hypothetical protein
MFDICSLKLNLLSIVTPKNLMEDMGFITEPSKCISSVNLDLWHSDIFITAVLVVFNNMLLSADHIWVARRAGTMSFWLA